VAALNGHNPFFPHEVTAMAKKTRRDFLRRGTLATAGLLAADAAAPAADGPGNDKPRAGQGQPAAGHPPGRGSLGSASDRGKLTPGARGPEEPPVTVDTPDLPRLAWKMKDGVKEYHLTAEPVKREFLPGQLFDVWGFNGSMPGPTIEAVEGDRVRIVVHNKLPEPLGMHWHGLEVPIHLDGVPHLTQDPIRPGQSFSYELTLHQNGTYFYHSHDAMQDVMGMVGLFLIHPKRAWAPAVDRDFGLILQEWAVRPGGSAPDKSAMDFSLFTINGHSAPYTTPLVVRQGERVRIRMVNFSVNSHHPMHLHGLTFWVTGTEAGRIPESAWVPHNTVLVGVAQAQDIEVVANNPGDWPLHCHMFHHVVNFMSGHMGKEGKKEGDGGGHGQHGGHMAEKGQYSEADIKKLNRPLTRGMRRDWFRGVEGLTTILRVLPPDVYDKVLRGEHVPPGASVPGSSEHQSHEY
jgi:FtsP/CotA-like multicopper oxidase with cupredoxin domain